MAGNFVEFICVFENLARIGTTLTLGAWYSKNYHKLRRKLRRKSDGKTKTVLF